MDMTTGGIVSEERIGFVGLGNMGGRMARRIVDAGVPVAGFDLRADNIIDAGARALPSPGAVISESDIVLLSLPDSRVVEAVVFGDDGLMAAAREGTIVVDLSTSSPDSTRRIGGELAAKRVSFLDARARVSLEQFRKQRSAGQRIARDHHLRVLRHHGVQSASKGRADHLIYGTTRRRRSCSRLPLWVCSAR